MPTHLPVIDDPRSTGPLRRALRFAGHPMHVAREYPCIKPEPGGQPGLARATAGTGHVPGE